MKLIKLTDGCLVNTDDISEITVNEYSSTITVRMKSGIGHSLSCDYGKGIYQTLDRLHKEINA